MKRNFLLTSFLVLLTLAGFAGTKNNAAYVPIATPTGLAATNTFQNSLKIDWTYTGSPTGGFSIVVTKDGTPIVTPITVADGALRTFTINTGDITYPLVANSVYTFTITALAALPADNSVVSAPSAPVTYKAALNQATDLIAHANTITYNSVQLQWTDNNGNDEDGYIIEYGETKVIVTSPGHINYTKTVTGLNPKTFYSFKVRAYKGDPYSDASAKSIHSNPATITTKVAPAAVPNIFFTNNCPTLVGVNWTIDRSEDIQTFIILRSFGGSFDVVGIKPRGESVYYDLDAKPGKTATYRVVAVNESTPNGQPSIDRSIYITPYSAPPTPVNVRSDKSLKSNSFLTIRWENPAFDNGCKSNVRTSNYVMYKLASESEYKQLAILNADANTIRIEGLKPKDVVDFRVFSFSDQGLTSAWAGGRDTTLGPPYAPSGLRASSSVDALGNTITTLLWEDNARDEDGFTVEVSTDNVTFMELGKRLFNEQFGLVNYIHTPVQEGLKYYYKVRAYSNSQGVSDYSPVISHTADYMLAPKAPYNLKATLTSGKVVLTWRDDSFREENFVVEKSSDNGTTYASIATLGRNVVTFTDENVAVNTSYKYRVKAMNTKGSSAYAMVDYKAATAAAARVAFNADAISLYPNPTADFVNIKIPAELRGTSGNIVITDKNSRIILDKTFKFDAEELNLDLNKYGEGMYNVTISTGDTKVSKKVYKF